MNDLNALTVPLLGRHLIEASAGTGKTFTITTLFLRLVVEQEVPVDRILVVTFTRAATAELRDRLRERLRKALAVIAGAEKDDVISKLVEAWPDVGRAQMLLERGIADFDLAPITTIHSFCQRALRENAFESAVAFDLELSEDRGPYIRRVAQDLWTTLTWKADRTFVSWLQEQVGFGDVVSLVDQALRAARPRILPEEDLAPLGDEGEAVRDAFETARKLWQSHGREAIDLVAGHKGMDGRRYRAGWSRGHGETLDAAFMAPTVPLGQDKVRKALAYLDPERLAEHTKDGHEPPDHPVLDALAALLGAWDAAQSAFERERVRLCQQIVQQAAAGLDRAKAPRDDLQFFDDLIRDLRDALCDAHTGPRLARALRDRYPAALLDEFQDTDPVQYEVFQRIHPESTDGTMFLIGDPKQAIYAFRGADLYAYLDARTDIGDDHTWNLGTNWRSDAPLVQAVNMLFERPADPFGESRITFRPVQAHHGTARLTIDGTAPAPLRFRVHRAKGWGRPPWRDAAEVGKIPATVADDIVELLSAEVRLPSASPDEVDRPLRPADIAVLVSSHWEAAEVQAALELRRVPCVRYGHTKVFTTPETPVLVALMEAVARPNDTRRVRAALITPLLGKTADDLDHMDHDEEALQAQLIRFRRWRATWDERGFMRMFQQLLHEEDAMARVLPTPGGERVLTNLRHLAELVHGAEQEGGLKPLGCIAWLVGQQEGRGSDASPAEVRLESDAAAVQVVTMHMSKGLEYPVVFCPYLWRPPRRGTFPVFHDPEAGEALSLQLHPEAHEAHGERDLMERRAERLRLAYVALTRARHLCVVTWGPFRAMAGGCGDSPLAHLLYPPEGGLGSHAATVDKLSADHHHATLVALAEAHPGLLEASWAEDREAKVYAPPVAPPTLMLPQSVRRRFASDVQISSFSALVRQAHEEAWERDVDRLLPGRPEETSDRGGAPLVLADFPRGARPGTCYHAILEELEFTQPDDAVAEAHVHQVLTRFGFDAEALVAPVLASVADVCRTPLGGGAPRLADVPRHKRLDELEFAMAAGTQACPLTPGALAEVFAQHGRPDLAKDVAARLGALGFDDLDGVLKGFVDLAFEHEGRWWVVDYKTNHLGDHLDDYDEPGLRRAMLHGDYVLQYHLYALALHRYLRTRVPGWSYESHMGGARYLFVRGMHPDAGATRGVFADKPSSALIEALDRVLDGQGVMA